MDDVDSAASSDGGNGFSATWQDSPLSEGCQVWPVMSRGQHGGAELVDTCRVHKGHLLVRGGDNGRFGNS